MKPSPFSGATAFADLAQRAKQLDVTHCLARSWNLLVRHFWLLFSATALVSIITIGVEFIPVAGTFVGMAFGLVLWAGLDWLFLKLIRGEPATSPMPSPDSEFNSPSCSSPQSYQVCSFLLESSSASFQVST